MADSPNDANEPTAARRAFLLTVLALVVAGHAFCLFSGRDDVWPFSRYSMYARAAPLDHTQQYVIVGVTPADEEIEIFLEWEYLRPLYRGSINRSLRRLAKDPQSTTLLERAAADCLRRYEKYRTSGVHDGPELQGMRVYSYEWRYDVVDPRTRAATHRTRLAEVRRPR